MKWKAILKTTNENRYPSKEECLVLLEKYATPENVRRHCIKVAQVAEAVATELNRLGANLDISLVISAGYLHDIARVHSKHDRVGAEYLISIGLEDVAKVICNHTFHKIDHRDLDINEEDILCIADRLVLEDRYVGPEKRMAYITSKALKKFGEEKRKDLNKAANNFIEYIRQLEVFIGKEISELL